MKKRSSLSYLDMHRLPHYQNVSNRRDFLMKSGAGFGALALSSLLHNKGRLSADVLANETQNTLLPHFSGKAKSVIFLFMEGGPSHIDLFDPKPELKKLAGQKVPDSYGRVITAMGEFDSPILPDQRKWKQHGQSGIWVSDWLPHTATCVDDIAVIRSCISDGINHSGGVCQMNTGSTLGGRPSLGSWVTYGLGTENQNLPSFVVLTDNPSMPTNGPRNWSAGFMPAAYQGTQLDSGDEPIANLNNPEGVTDERQWSKLRYIQKLNKQHLLERMDQSELDARIRSYELAFRMQASAPEAVDLSLESESTRFLYGMDEDQTAVFGRNCLLARRLVERGVRFVQLYHGSGSKWDAHSGIENNHKRMCGSSDKPVAGLIKDLKQRGLLEETLVIWGGEFGRTPMSEQGNGRDHNPTGFTMWMAGGGVQGGQVIGKTDDIGLHAIEDRLHVHDLHATILHLMGIHHLKLVYHHLGRPETATLNEGAAYSKITGQG